MSTHTEPLTTEPRSLSGFETDQYRRAYVTAMCWANAIGEADDGSDMEDHTAIEDSLTADMLTELYAQANAFLADELTDSEADAIGLDHGETVETVIAALADSQQYAYHWTQAGHDFALTRNGHGAGFWDRGIGAAGEILTAHAKAYGSAYVFGTNDTAQGTEG